MNLNDVVNELDDVEIGTMSIKYEVKEKVLLRNIQKRIIESVVNESTLKKILNSKIFDYVEILKKSYEINIEKYENKKLSIIKYKDLFQDEKGKEAYTLLNSLFEVKYNYSADRIWLWGNKIETVVNKINKFGIKYADGEKDLTILKKKLLNFLVIKPAPFLIAGILAFKDVGGSFLSYMVGAVSNISLSCMNFSEDLKYPLERLEKQVNTAQKKIQEIYK